MPSAASAVPTRSSRGRRAARDSGISRAAPKAAISPSGRLTKKISRQPLPNALAAISAPPRIGPSTADPPITGPNTVNAFPSSLGSNTSCMIPRPCGISKAAEAPWASRQLISIAESTANAQASDEATNPSEPKMNSRLRP